MKAAKLVKQCHNRRGLNDPVHPGKDHIKGPTGKTVAKRIIPPEIRQMFPDLGGGQEDALILRVLYNVQPIRGKLLLPQSREIGLTSAVRGAGAVRLGFPSGVREPRESDKPPRG